MLHPPSKEIHHDVRWALDRRFPLIDPSLQTAISTPGTPAGFFYRFINQNLVQREERAVDSARILGALLARPDAKLIASELDPEYRPHRRLVCEDLLAEIRDEVRSALTERYGRPLSAHLRTAIDARLDQHYRGVMAPFIIALQERKTAPGAKKGASLPNGFLSGRQGTINSLTLLDYILNESAGLSLRQQLEAIGAGALSVEFLSSHHFGGALTSKFNNSPSEALQAHFRQHPSPRVRRCAAHLGQEHFPQVNSLWSEVGEADTSPGDGWEFDSQRSCWLNKPLARRAIGQVIDDVIANPTGRPLPSADYIARIETLIATATENSFNNHRVRFNRTFGTIIPVVYNGSLPEAIADYLQNVPSNTIRHHFASLQPYHFRRMNSWSDPAGNPKYEMGKVAIHEAFTTLEKHLGPERFDLWRIPEIFENQWMFKDIFFCRFSPGDVATGVFGFPLVRGIITYLRNHPNPRVAEFYRDLAPRHFARVTNGLWSARDFGDNATPHGWSYDPTQERFVNLAEARKMTAELLSKLLERGTIKDVHPQEIATKITLNHFNDVALSFNSRARAMLSSVYGDSPRKAILDLILSDDFLDLMAKQRESGKEMDDERDLVALRATAQRVLALPQRGRFSSNA